MVLLQLRDCFSMSVHFFLNLSPRLLLLGNAEVKLMLNICKMDNDYILMLYTWIHSLQIKISPFTKTLCLPKI